MNAPSPEQCLPEPAERGCPDPASAGQTQTVRRGSRRVNDRGLMGGRALAGTPIDSVASLLQDREVTFPVLFRIEVLGRRHGSGHVGKRRRSQELRPRFQSILKIEIAFKQKGNGSTNSVAGRS